jgi:galactokinase
MEDSVMPIAIDLGIKATLTKRNDGRISLSSSTHNKRIEFDIANIPAQYNTDNDWCNYPIGVLRTMQKDGITLNGFDLLLGSNLPEGSGLSSSAAIKVLTAFILLHQADKGLDLLPSLAVLCQKVENEFIGV